MTEPLFFTYLGKGDDPMKTKACLLLVILLFAASAHFASAETAVFTWGDYEYALEEDGSARITKYTGKEAELVIPSLLDGRPVTVIGPWAFSPNDDVISLTIPGTVRRIEEDAFARLTKLTSLTIPEGVESVGSAAFSHCFLLREVSLPDTLTEVGWNPWSMCQKLTDIRVSPNHPALEVIDGVLFGRADRRLICCPIGLGMTDYDIPQGTVIIGKMAFFNCTSLKSFTIPESVRTIEEQAFWYCIFLTDITIPDTVTNIGDYAFSHCGVVTLTVTPGGYAERYCEKFGVYYRYPDYLDWLKE